MRRGIFFLPGFGFGALAHWSPVMGIKSRANWPLIPIDCDQSRSARSASDSLATRLGFFGFLGVETLLAFDLGGTSM